MTAGAPANPATLLDLQAIGAADILKSRGRCKRLVKEESWLLRQGLVDLQSQTWPWALHSYLSLLHAGIRGMCLHTLLKNDFIQEILCVVKLAVIKRELFLCFSEN